MAWPVNAEDITASANTLGVTESILGVGIEMTFTRVRPISSASGMNRVSSTCSPLRSASMVSIRAWVNSIRPLLPRPGAGLNVPGAKRVEVVIFLRRS